MGGIRRWLPPRWSVGAAAVLLSLGAVFILPVHYAAPNCSGRAIEVENALGKSRSALELVADADTATRCAAYRERLDLLLEAQKLSQICGDPLMARANRPEALAAEALSFRHLVDNQCVSATLGAEEET